MDCFSLEKGRAYKYNAVLFVGKKNFDSLFKNSSAILKGGAAFAGSDNGVRNHYLYQGDKSGLHLMQGSKDILAKLMFGMWLSRDFAYRNEINRICG